MTNAEIQKHLHSFHYIFFYFAILVLTSCLLVYATRVKEVAEETQDEKIMCNCNAMIVFLSLVLVVGFASACCQFAGLFR